MIRPCFFWLHQFHLERIHKRSPETVGRPLAIYNSRKKVVLCNSEAMAQGVSVGMGLKAAVALLDRLSLQPAPLDGPEAIKELARRLLRFSPLVGVWGEEEVVVDLRPSAHLFGGELALVRKIRAFLEGEGFSSYAGAGDSVAAARLAARVLTDKVQPQVLLSPGSEAERTGRISLAALYSFPEVAPSAMGRPLLNFLKVETLAAIRGVIRPGMPALAREWEELRRYAELSPELNARITRVDEPVTHKVDIFFVPPVIDMEPLLQQLLHAHQQLSARLEAEQALMSSAMLVLVPEDRLEIEVPLVLAKPTRDPKRMVELWRLKLGEIELTRPLSAVRLIADRITPQEKTHTELLVRNKQKTLTLPELQNRLQALLGPEGILYRPVLTDSLLPHKQVVRGDATAPDTGTMEREESSVVSCLYSQCNALPPFPLHLLNHLRRRRASRVFLGPPPVVVSSEQGREARTVSRYTFFDPEKGELRSVRYATLSGQGGPDRLIRELSSEGGVESISVVGTLD